MNQELTERQKQVYRYMVEYLKDNHSLPTMEQVGEHFGISLNAAQCHKNLMIKKGWISKIEKGRYRLGQASVIVKTHCTV